MLQNKIYTYTHTLDSYTSSNLVAINSDPKTLDYFYVVNTVNGSDNSYRMFIQRNADTTMKYQIRYDGNVIAKSVTFSNDTSTVYFILGSSNRLNIMSINLTDGSLLKSLRFTELKCDINYCRVLLTNLTDEIYVTAQDVSAAQSYFCKINLTSPYDYQWSQFFTSITEVPPAVQLVNSQTLYYTAISNVSGLIFGVIDTLSNTHIWSQKIDWPNGDHAWNIGLSEILLSSDQTELYTLTSYKNEALLISLDPNDGTLIRNIYQHTDSCGQIRSMIQIGNKLHLLAEWSNSEYIIYNLTSQEFEIYSLNNSYEMWSLYYNTNTSRFVFGGHKSVNELIDIRVYEQFIEYHEDLRLATSSTIEPITSYSISEYIPASRSITQTSNTGSNNTNLNVTVTTVASSITFSSDISFNVFSKTAKVDRDTVTQLNIRLPCYETTFTTFTYTLADYGSNLLPSWVTLDSANYKLNLTTPDVSTTTAYRFAVNVTFENDINIYQKPITINVIYNECEVEHWYECEISGKECKQWDSGYEMKNGATSCDKIESAEEVDILSYTTIAILSIGITVSVSASLLTSSSPQSIWLMVNQYQLYILLPLTGVYMPKDVINYLIGMEFTSFNLNFLNAKETFKFDELLHDIDSEENDWYRTEIGIESQSAIVNQISLLFGLLLLALIHLVVILVNYVFQK